MGCHRDTLYAARMARDLLWEEERSINLNEFVAISQTYVSWLPAGLWLPLIIGVQPRRLVLNPGPPPEAQRGKATSADVLFTSTVFPPH